MQLRLRYKLFLAILLANALLTAVIVVANNQAFTASFEAYLTSVQSRRLAPLLDSLAEEYEEHGDWSWVHTDPEDWQRITRRFLSPRHERRLYRDRTRTELRVRSAMTLQLRDANGQVILGNLPLEGRTSWIPIEVGGQRVGELGIPVNLHLTSEFDQVFADQQRRQLRWIALLALLLAAAVAIPFAGALAGPIARLQHATRQLANGRYDVKLPQQGSDELSELARDFNSLADTLKQNLSARQRWIADISHELRTPVSVLQAELEALEDGVIQPDKATLGSLHQEILRLGRLIADLHELSLSDAGALNYRKIPVDLNALVESVCNHNRTRLAQRHIELDVQNPGHSVILQGDPDRLTQLVSNLMQNSLNYTDGFDGEPGLLRIQLWQSNQGTHLTWSDSAPGVPDDALPKLFQRLYRVEHSRSRQTGGSGLGLSIVRNIIDAHKGRIVAKRSPLGGLTLELIFPNPEIVQ